MKTLYVSLAVLLLIAQHGSAQWKGFTHLDNPMAVGMIDTSLFISQQGSDGHTYRYSATAPGPPYGLIESDSGLPSGTVTSFGYLTPTYFIGTSDRGVFRSTDRGQHWILCRVSLGNTCFATLGTVMFAAGGGIYRSEDSGANWTVSDSGLSGSVTGMATLGTNIYSGGGGGVYRSIDGGHHWVTTNFPTGGVLGVAVIKTTLFAAAQDNGVYRSTDSGGHWFLADSGVPALQKTCFVTDGKNLFLGTGAGGVGDGVYCSTNEGDSWDTVNANLPYLIITGLTVFDTNLIANVNTYWGASSGLYIRPISQMVPPDTGPSDIVSLPTQNGSVEIYPNPTLGTFSILSSQPILGIQVRNVLGTDILDVSRINQPYTSIDLSNSPSGSYFIEIQTASGTVLRKVVRE